ncbi:DUF3168 domain-containing protein [Paenibacillus sp. IHBB 3054]|uniref:DUF3168 domain-containing protein n=1 Tax=Paenibacillus sp. IHBB 3054 TaxID=3425689 RepID=UPI003F67F595
MNFEEALTFELETIPGFVGKVFPGFIPGKSVPYIAYISSDGQRTKSLGGYMSSRRVPVELNIVAKRYEELKPYISAAVDVLVSFEGRQIGEAGPHIQELIYEPPVELYEEAPKLYRGVIDFSVYF